MQSGIAMMICLCAGLAGPARAQSIDTSTARLTLGQPITLSLRVRGGDEPMRHLPAECLQARLRYGDDPATALPLQVRTHAEGDLTHVTLSHPDRLSGLIVHARIELLCGPGYAREFVLLSDPPLAGPIPAATERRRSRSKPAARTAAPLAPVMPAASTPGAAPLDQAQLQWLAGAVRTLLQLEAPPAAPMQRLAAPVEPTVDPVKAALLNELDQLRQQQNRTATSMNELLARLEAQDRQRGLQILWLLCAMLLTWLATRLLPPVWATLLDRLHARLVARRRPARHTPEATEAASLKTPVIDTEAGASPQGARQRQVIDLDTGNTAPQQHHPAIRRHERRHWPAGDGGQPSLQSPPVELLDKLDTLLAQGYPGACAVVLEQALQDEPLKPPWLLLRLLEVYRQLGQPTNHEGVCAQLEALYNVQIPALEQSDDAAPLLEQSAALREALCLLWAGPDRVEQLAGWLLRPSPQPAFDLPSFSTLLWLHGLACILEDETAVPMAKTSHSPRSAGLAATADLNGP